MPPTKAISCPLCGGAAESAVPLVPGGGVRPGLTAVACPGPCTSFLIETTLIGQIPAGIASTLSLQAASRFEEDPDHPLEITHSLVQKLAGR